MKTRIKMHQMPGDLCCGDKIRIMEGKTSALKCEKSFRNMILDRERAVLKERTKKEIQEAKEEMAFMSVDQEGNNLIEFEANRDSLEETLNLIPDGYKVCKYCKGTGYQYYDDRVHECCTCDHLGYLK